jgi:hypothetical protein
MKKVVLYALLSLWLTSGVAQLAGAATQAQPSSQTAAERAVDPLMARQLDQLMTADPTADASLSKREVKKRLSAKQKVQKALGKLKAKVGELKRPVDDLADLLKTIGIIFIIVGAVLLVLGIILSGGAYYGGGGGLLVLGLILYLIARYAL